MIFANTGSDLLRRAAAFFSPARLLTFTLEPGGCGPDDMLPGCLIPAHKWGRLPSPWDDVDMGMRAQLRGFRA